MFRESAMQGAVGWEESDPMRWHVRAPKPDSEPLLSPESNLLWKSKALERFN
jgi:hypothetical protein